MSLELQAKLLRIIETGEVKRLGSNRIQKCDVRIIAATNRNLREMVEEKAFRADLYYRLNVLTIHVPPLRERVADIAPLTRYFVQLFNKKYGFTKHLMPALIRALEQWSWPGNVRELRNTVERMMVESRDSIIDAAAFREIPPGISSPKTSECPVPDLLPYQQAMNIYEREYLSAMVASCGGDLRKAAGKMELHLSTLYRKLEKLGLKPPRTSGNCQGPGEEPLH
mgnify:FL=1